MQYYVIGPDGNKYGPADVPTLKGWVAENRLNPTSMLEDFNTGQRVPASSVSGLFGDAPTMAAAPGPTMGPAGASPYSQVPSPGGPGYYNPQQGANYDNGSSDLTLAWVFGALGLFCCGPVAIAGLMKANSAQTKGNPGANAARIFNIVAMIIWVISVILRFTIFASAFSQAASGGRPPFTP